MEPTKQLIYMVMIFFFAMIFWESRLIYPVKVMVTLFHEAGHALAAILTGGKVEEIRVNKNLSGVTSTTGGNRIIMLNAGYFGSAVFGFLIFWLTYTRAANFSLLLIALMLILFTALWVKEGFGLVFIPGMAIVLILVSVFAWGGDIPVNMAREFGLLSLFYAFIDMWVYAASISSDTEHRSDAAKLQDHTKIPARFWAYGWQLLSLLLFWGAFNMIVNNPG